MAKKLPPGREAYACS